MGEEAKWNQEWSHVLRRVALNSVDDTYQGEDRKNSNVHGQKERETETETWCNDFKPHI